MTKREKIIVFIMILTIIYGFYDLVLSKQFKKNKRTSTRAVVSSTVNGGSRLKASDKRLIDKISNVLKEDEAAATNAYVASRADEDWKNDPFSMIHYTADSVEKTSMADLDETTITYNGYVEIGSTKVAIINGTDYQVGDELETGGYRVKRIDESNVILESKRMGKKIRIPFIEEK